jgi:hypothetical protein
MNEPPNSGTNQPPGYGQTPPGYGQPPQGYGQPPQGYAQPQYQHPQSYAQPVPNSGSYAPPPQGRTGFTRQMFNPATYRQPGSGSWAASSLILSLVSLVLCLGLIAPLPMILGLVGMVGNKRAKGMAFAGFMLSALQVAGWAAVLGFGLLATFQTGTMAENGGKPVVAAIEDFKNDHKRVPNSLDELVSEGYLPPTWEQGLDEVDGNVSKVVKGKRWTDFLRYKPGSDATWTGTTGWVDVANNGTTDDWEDYFNLPASTEGQTYQTYGLAFIGLDGFWGTSDDAAVNQAPEKPYELTAVWGGDNQTRELAKNRRELQRMQRSLQAKKESLETSLNKANSDLEQVEGEVRDLMNKKNLDSLEAVKKDSKGAGLLKLAGATAKRQKAAEKKLGLVEAKIDDIGIQVRLLANEEEMAKLADSPQEMAELVALLEDSQKVLDDKVDLGALDKLDDDQAASDWFNSQIK